MTTTAIRTELASQVGNAVPTKMRSKLAVDSGLGTGDSGFAAASCSVLNALASWITNG